MHRQALEAVAQALQVAVAVAALGLVLVLPVLAVVRPRLHPLVIGSRVLEAVGLVTAAAGVVAADVVAALLSQRQLRSVGMQWCACA